MTKPKAVVEELLRRLVARDDRVLDDLVAVDMVNHAAGAQGRDRDDVGLLHQIGAWPPAAEP